MMQLLNFNSEEELAPAGELRILNDLTRSPKALGIKESPSEEMTWNSSSFEEVFFDAFEDRANFSDSFRFENSIRNIQRSMSRLSTTIFDEEEPFPSKALVDNERERRKSFGTTRNILEDLLKIDETGEKFDSNDFSQLPEVRVRLRRQRTVCGLINPSELNNCPKDFKQTSRDKPSFQKFSLNENESRPVLRPNASKLKENRKRMQSWNALPRTNYPSPPPFRTPTSSHPSPTSSLCDTPASSDSFHSCQSSDFNDAFINNLNPSSGGNFQGSTKKKQRKLSKNSTLSISKLSLISKDAFDSDLNSNIESKRRSRISNKLNKLNFRKRKSLIKSCIYPETSCEELATYFPPSTCPSATVAPSDDAFPQRLKSFESDFSVNSSSALTVRLRKATSTVKKELRRTLKSWSTILSPSSASSIDPFEDPFADIMASDFSSSEKIALTERLDLPRHSSGGPQKEQSAVFPWRRDEQRISENLTSEEVQNGLRDDVDSLQNDAKFYEEELYREASSEPFLDEGEEEDRTRIAFCEEPNSSSSSYGKTSISRSEWDIHRPWSQTYTECHAPSLSQSACRLSLEAEHRCLNQDEQSVEALSMPYTVTSENLTHNMPEGKFQKFKKTLSLRLAKKGCRSESPCRGGDKPPLVQTIPPLVGDSRNQPDDIMNQQNRNAQREEEFKSTYFKFGHPLFRSSKERKRAKLRDSRSSKCNSGDSGDSGIELASGTSTLVGDVALLHQNDEAALFGNDLHGNGETVEASSSDLADVGKQKILRRTRSDMSSRSPQLHLLGNDAHYRQSLGRQYSSPQPIKIRPYHRLPNYSIDPLHRNSRLKRTKGSTHLRRSVSQPLDLDKSFQAQVSFLKMRIPDEESFVQKQCRRPSVGNLLSDDNTSEEEGGLSDTEDFRQGFKRCLEDEEELIVFAEALWDHVSLDADELVFKAGDLITVLDSSDKDWWWGRITHRSGWFPASFVRLLVNQEDHHQSEGSLADVSEDENWSSRKPSLSSLSQDQVRANVINEILSTERDYVKHLKDVVEGYLRQVRKRPDMFSEETIATIFGNMEALYNFHAHFLSELEQCIDYDSPHRSCIGESFTRNKSRFEIYSEYCNNHPSAVSELQELYQDHKYVHYFEACRLLQEMIDISLDGFLLTPVQKICKYPLQLQELLKYTRPNHPDYATVHGAMQAMKEVALLVNERRRRMECLEKIASWQKGVEGWEGPDLLDDSSQLIHQGEVTKGIGGSWPKEVTLFLFDHQMVYCKKDLLKRNTYVYRGRINTDLCEVIDIPDDPMRSAAFHHAWKIHCLHKSKTYVFTCKTAEEKVKWLQAFKRERALVAMDEASGFVASEKQKQVARMAAINHRSRPKRPRVKTHGRKQVMTYAQAQLLVNTEKGEENRSHSLPVRSQQTPSEAKKKGLWFSFGGHKKGRSSGRTQKHNSFHNS